MFGDDENQRDLRGLARELLDDCAGEGVVRATMATEDGHDASFWSVLADAGLLGLSIAEDLGGSSCGLTEVGIVAEEMGARVACAPWLATMSAVSALLAADSDEAAARLSEIAAGRMVATLAVGEGRFPVLPDQLATTASCHAGRWTLDGTKRFVLDGACADLFLVLARTPDGPTLFAAPRSAEGVEVSRLSTMDLTRKLSDVHLTEVRAEPIGRVGEGWPIARHALDETLCLLAMEQVGGAARALHDTVEYAKIRYQFGRPIGSFQAIKHRCATMLVDVESARSAACYALWAADHEPNDLPIAARIAASACSDAYSSVAAATIQLHGGIGFTWEHPAHLYFKRAHGSRVLFGSPTAHRAELADLIGVTSSTKE